MRQNKFLKVVKILLFVVVAATVLGFVVKELWNALLPAIFGWHMITFWQALGLLVLSKILFGGFHRHGGRGGWRHRMKERWEQMTPEEREQFRKGMRCGHWRGREHDHGQFTPHAEQQP
ncbi:hypothetical protein GCM10011507_08280 [Edaphobacter acidisoli]|uniref:Uncharacterized protein n=2 Tax=Edaphobacter acidisoli TaxID=2040573 RepID=A0A916RJ31_9BACT|nr:hypothetical protein GCM10011507_08280 [Edaphobacter acidisoli]